MLFNSFEFLLVFLPLALLGFAWLSRISETWAKTWLVLCSLFFYGWWSPVYLWLLGLSVVANYVLGAFLFRAPPGPAKSRWLAAGVGLNLLALGYFKYANFFVETVNATAGTHLFLAQIALPLAISFFTFTEIVFLIEVSKSSDHYYSFLDYVFFVTFFPHLIAGPIVRHWEVMPQLEEKRLGLRAADLTVGLFIFVLGLGKKVLLADAVAEYARPFFDVAAAGGTFTSADAWLGALAYTLQLYFDFSGYSDMAIGLARMFGIKFPANFSSPYQARSIADFWNRWHITLTRFFREYVYFRLGGNRCGLFRQIFNVIATMFLSGLWHGANWTFIVWGAFHGVLLAINHLWRRLGLELRHPLGRRCQGIAGYLLTMLCVIVGWVYFRASSVEVANRILASMFSFPSLTLPETFPFSRILAQLPLLQLSPSQLSTHTITELFVLAVVVLIAAFGPNTQQILARYEPILERVTPDGTQPMTINTVTAAVVGVILGLSLFSINKASEFLYYQF
ncbi:MAG TPA: MBOAT family protein [Chthoniobacteraceae bacterium]